MKRQKLRLVGILLSGAAVIGLASAAFRTETHPEYPLGEAVITWRWGMTRKMSVDFDRDRREDIIGIYAWNWRAPSADDPFEETRERIACKDVFDLRVSYQRGGIPRTLEMDLDCDGVREKRIEGDDVSQQLAEIRAGSDAFTGFFNRARGTS